MGLGSAVLVSVERDWVSSDQRHVCKPSLWSPHACYDSDVLTSHKWSTNNYYNNDNNKIQLGKINFTNVSEAEKLSENWQRISPWGCDWRTGARCWFHANITLFFRVLSECSQSSESLSIWKQPFPRSSYKASSLSFHHQASWFNSCFGKNKNKLEWKVENNFQVTDRVFIVLAFLAIS